MTSTLKQSRTEALEAWISAAERQIAESNERIILDLMRGRDTIADEERVAREVATLSHIRRRRGRPAGRPVR
jgi:3-deoxy-D-arabino-heptulosonate 7-phosphate (DAHP) synthase